VFHKPTEEDKLRLHRQMKERWSDEKLRDRMLVGLNNAHKRNRIVFGPDMIDVVKTALDMVPTPTLAGLARKLGVSRSTLRRYLREENLTKPSAPKGPPSSGPGRKRDRDRKAARKPAVGGSGGVTE
jgi:AraC-like DNA-binding protein